MNFFTRFFKNQKTHKLLDFSTYDYSLHPVLTFSICNRYWELVNNLKLFQKMRDEFPIEPTILIIWARPDEEHKWVFDVLKKNNLLHCLIPRPILHGEELSGTSYPESFNIRLALEFCQANFKNSFMVFQTADAFPKPGLYKFMCDRISQGANLVTTGVNDNGNWLSTLAFAIRTDAVDYWPPRVPIESWELLEYEWWKATLGKKIHYYHNQHNFGYLTSHDFETQKQMLKDIRALI